MYWLKQFAADNFLNDGIKIGFSLYVTWANYNKVIIFKWVGSRPIKYRLIYEIRDGALTPPHVQKIDYAAGISYIVAKNSQTYLITKSSIIYKNHRWCLDNANRVQLWLIDNS